MMIRYRPHESVRHDGGWTCCRLPLRGFAAWHRCWREDFVIEIDVLGQWTPAHVVLTTEVIPSAA
jgi:hypothetical protein